MKNKIKHFTFIGPAAWCSFKPESQNSSSRYRELHNLADALMQSKKKMKNKIMCFTLTGPANRSTFNPIHKIQMPYLSNSGLSLKFWTKLTEKSSGDIFNSCESNRDSVNNMGL
jgi:hypothetical protein